MQSVSMYMPAWLFWRRRFTGFIRYLRVRLNIFESIHLSTLPPSFHPFLESHSISIQGVAALHLAWTPLVSTTHHTASYNESRDALECPSPSSWVWVTRKGFAASIHPGCVGGCTLSELISAPGGDCSSTTA